MRHLPFTPGFRDQILEAQRSRHACARRWEAYLADGFWTAPERVNRVPVHGCHSPGNVAVQSQARPVRWSHRRQATTPPRASPGGNTTGDSPTAKSAAQSRSPVSPVHPWLSSPCRCGKSLYSLRGRFPRSFRDNSRGGRESSGVRLDARMMSDTAIAGFVEATAGLGYGQTYRDVTASTVA